MILSHVCRIMLKVSVSRRRNESMTLCASAPERNNPPPRYLDQFRTMFSTIEKALLLCSDFNGLQGGHRNTLRTNYAFSVQLCPGTNTNSGAKS